MPASQGPTQLCLQVRHQQYVGLQESRELGCRSVIHRAGGVIFVSSLLPLLWVLLFRSLNIESLRCTSSLHPLLQYHFVSPPASAFGPSGVALIQNRASQSSALRAIIRLTRPWHVILCWNALSWFQDADPSTSLPSGNSV